MASKRLKKKKQAVKATQRQQNVPETESSAALQEKTAREPEHTAEAADGRTAGEPEDAVREDVSAEEPKAQQETGKEQEVCFQIEVNLQEETEEMKQMNFYVQWNGKEYCQADIVEQIRAQWKNMGNTQESLETLNIYLKPEEEKAYYVANGSVQGCVEL